ncbi:MAG: SsrA-binding protein SmpB [Bacteroidia bacterium]|nr:SsrA-binding protein SmpB [Bacteroidia bacterium]
MKDLIAIKNKKAGFEFQILESYTAGIQLTGTEIKSIRAGKANLSDSYCLFENEELWVKNMHISEYKEGSYNNVEPKRQRKLLLTKKELRKLNQKVKVKGLTMIPVKLFINERGFAKLEIALARGKKFHDKRQDLKLKEARREMRTVKR